MLPLFTFPWGFLALLAIPALVGIYWFRSKYRKRTVSSLILWVQHKEAREGGSRLERFQSPLVFFLELLALLLCVLAAIGPKIHAAKGSRPMVIILDDSYSMLAGNEDSPRTRAIAQIDKLLQDELSYSVQFLLAGPTPQLLGETVRTAREGVRMLKGWRCLSPSTNLKSAISLGAEVAGERALLLIVTDHGPDEEPEEGRVQWWSFGVAQPNIAFVNAARTIRDDLDRCLLEIANLADDPLTTSLTLNRADTGAELLKRDLALAGSDTRRVVFEIPSGVGALTARLGNDSLEIDNQVALLPETPRAVRVQMQISDEVLHSLTERAVNSIPNTRITSSRPQLIFTDSLSDRYDEWVVRFTREEHAEAYVGPFVMDRSHPITNGLSLQGAVWAAGKEVQVPGRPVVMAGNIPLITDVESLTGRHDVRIRLQPDLSTVQDSPDWPILIWNLLQWRGGQAPGLDRANVRLGSEITVQLPRGSESVELRDPAGVARSIAVIGDSATIKAESVGVFDLQAGEQSYSFAVNALARSESDLRFADTQKLGNWLDEEMVRMEYQSIVWILLLIVLALLTAHAGLLAYNRRQ